MNYIPVYLFPLVITSVIRRMLTKAYFQSTGRRNRYLLLLFLVSSPFCSIAQFMSRIDCHLPQTKDSTECKLIVKRLDQNPIINSTLVLDGHAIFVVDIPEPAPAYVWIENRREDVKLFIDSSHIHLAFSTQPADPPHITGSVVTELWQQQDSLLTQLVESHTEIRSAFTQTSLPNDSIGVIDRYGQLADSLQAIQVAALTKLITDHPTAISSWYLYASYFPVLSYRTKIQLFPKLSSFESYPSYQKIQRLLSLNKVGQRVASFELPTLRDSRLILDKLKAKYILLEFTSTYLASSKRRHRALQKLYATYHERGLEIVTISREFDRKAAQTALLKEQLPWPVVLTVEGQSSLSNDYHLESLPTTILLNNRKEIIARDVPISDLDDKLSSLLTQ